MNVTIQRQVERVETLFPSADPDWRFTDAAGHEHHRQDDTDNPYPTLTFIGEGCGYPDHGPECEGAGHYVCTICRERIEPGTVPPGSFLVEVGPPLVIVSWRRGLVPERHVLTEQQWIEAGGADATIETIRAAASC